jgi:hypothetical protein
MFKKYPKIIFFIPDAMPTLEEILAAEDFGPNTVFRNASFVQDEGALEICDGVAGAVPDRYAETYRPAEEVLEEFYATRTAPEAPESDEPAEVVAKPAPAKQKASAAKSAPVAPVSAPVWKPNA